MSYFVMLGLFLLKHGLLAHVVDFGYSLSRLPSRRYWFLGLLGHCSVEAATSLVLFFQFNYTWGEVAWVLALETAALAASSLVERRAPLRRLLVSHVLCETGVLAVYAAVLFLVGTPSA